MNNRERTLALLNYENYDRVPVVHFGFWHETLVKWEEEGHITKEERDNWSDGNEYDKSIGEKLGFDFNWYSVFSPKTDLFPPFKREVIETSKEGYMKIVNSDGVIILEKVDTVSIPREIDHLLKDRESFEKYYLPKLQFSMDRIDFEALNKIKNSPRENPLGLHCGSLLGRIRDILGVEELSYLYVDDEDLYDEIIKTIGDLSYELIKTILSTGVKFDFAHFWEDICFKNGPLVNPSVFEEKVGPYYKKITTLLKENGINIISLDCDGMIDSLIPTWLNNGVNTMFPIEVGTWDGCIGPWREKYGKVIRGVGGMNKNVFAEDYNSIDEEIERLKKLISLGGYIPCPDHRIPPDAKWENVVYYCEKLKKN